MAAESHWSLARVLLDLYVTYLEYPEFISNGSENIIMATGVKSSLMSYSPMISH